MCVSMFVCMCVSEFVCVCVCVCVSKARFECSFCLCSI